MPMNTIYHLAADNIILMSSAAGRLLSQASAAYGVAEARTLMLMRHLAQELGPLGVRANAIAPSIVRKNTALDDALNFRQSVVNSRPHRRRLAK
jgi:NAD(P)-dependent dehydrogenase (short-subunit alcohol dehydrogenase family)